MLLVLLCTIIKFQILFQLHQLIDKEEDELEQLQHEMQSKRLSLVNDNPELAHQLEECEKEEKEMQLIHQQKEKDYKERWNQELENITQENLKVEEAWKDIEENEQELLHLQSTIDSLSKEEQRNLQEKQFSIQEAKLLLKEEEQRLSEKEKQVLEQVEREMEEWESTKLSEMTDLIEKRHTIIEGDEELKLLLSEMSEKSKTVQDYETSLKSIRKTLDDVESEEDEAKSLIGTAEMEIKSQLSALDRTLLCLDEEEDSEVTDMKTMLGKIEDYCDTEILGIQKDKDMYVII